LDRRISMKLKYIGTTLFYLVFISGITSLAGSAPRSMVLTQPGFDWGVEMNTPGVFLERNIYNPKEGTSYFLEGNKKIGLFISGSLEKAPEDCDAKRFRDVYWGKLQTQPLQRDNIITWESGNKAGVEFIIKKVEGENINQKNIFVFLVRYPCCAYIHISKINYTAKDDVALQTILRSIQINSISGAQESEQAFLVPNYGYLIIPFPKTWMGYFNCMESDLSYEFKIRPPDSTMEIMISAFGPKDRSKIDTAADVKQFVIGLSRSMQKTAVEKELLVQEIKGEKTFGYYFSCTDKAPKPGESKYATQGVIKAGEVSLVFTLLYNEKNPELINQVLQILSKTEQQSE
jgi:hypothetical protein